MLRQRGFSAIEIIIALVVLAVIGFIVYRVLSSDKPASNDTTATAPAQTARSDGIVMKSIGFTLDNYNPTTNRAGDMAFTKLPLQFDQIWSDFGQQDPRSPNDPTKRNPQPTFVLPLGTKVQAMIDGKVTKVESLYSNDYTIWIAPTSESQVSFEHEHVVNPTVKVGDIVTSGQVIAEVSPHDSQHHPGFGVLEIGVLGQQDNRPVHTCPFEYLDASVKDDLLKKITAVHDAWEQYLGKDIYPATSALPGCVSLEPFKE